MKKIKCKLFRSKCFEMELLLLLFTIQIKGTTTRKHNLNLKCMKVWTNFASKVTEGNTCFAKKFIKVQYIKQAFKFILVCICMSMCMCMCMCNVYDQYCTCMAQVSRLSCGCCNCPSPGSPSATITFLPCLPGTMLRAPLVSASPIQCPVQPPPAACRKTQLQPPFFTFYVVHCVSEWQTILGQWPWQTAAAALGGLARYSVHSTATAL